MADKASLEKIYDMARAVRDENRPSMEFAAAAIGEALERSGKGQVHPGIIGPDRWSWALPGNRTITLSRSANEEAPGHPLLTIREEICPPLDNQLCSSALVTGTSHGMIIRNIMTILVNHTAAMAGLLAASRASIGGTNPLETIERISVDIERTISGEWESIVAGKKPSGTN